MYSEEFMMYLASYQKEDKQHKKPAKKSLLTAFLRLLRTKWIKTF